MVTLAESLSSSTSRPLRLRMRPDLSARRQRYHGRSYWVVKEPVGLNYFRFHEEEYAILCMLDGQSSLDDIKERFEDEFTPQKITFTDLQQFVGMLHRSGLVISEAAGQGRQLRRRRDQKKNRELLGKFTNVFALRFRGVDPERFFDCRLPVRRLVVLAARDAADRPARTVRLVAGRRGIRHLPLAAADVSPVLRPAQLALAGGDHGRGQGPARVRSRPVVQALRRRVPRDRRDVPGVYALPVLQRLRLLDAAQQVAPRLHRRGRHVRRDHPGLAGHLHLVVQRTRTARTSLR